MKRFVPVAVAGAVLVAGCASTPKAASRGTLVPLTGAIQVRHEGDWKDVTSSTDLAIGDLVRSAADGKARIDVPGGSLELAQGTQVELQADRSQVMTGGVLAQGPGAVVGVKDARFVPMADGSVFRVNPGVSTILGVYRGMVQVASRAEPVSVPALRQAVLVAGTVPQQPRPLVVSPQNPWDLRMLHDAIDAGLGLFRLQRGFGIQVEGLGNVPRVIAQALSGRLSLTQVRSLLQGNDPSEVFLALSLAMRAAGPAHRTMFDLAREVLDLRRQGGSWILVIAELGVQPNGLLGVIGAILDSIPKLFRSNPGPTTTSGAAATTAPASGSSSSPSSSNPGDSGGGSTPGTGGGKGGGGGGGTTTNSCSASDTSCQVDTLVGNLIGSFGQPSNPAAGGIG